MSKACSPENDDVPALSHLEDGYASHCTLHALSFCVTQEESRGNMVEGIKGLKEILEILL